MEAAQEVFRGYKVAILDLEEVVTENGKRVLCENVDVALRHKIALQKRHMRTHEREIN